MKYLVKTLDGLEEELAKEIIALGGKSCEILTRAVACEGDLAFLYKANLCLRTAISILIPMTEVEVNNEDELYNEVYVIPWYKIFGLRQTFAIKATVSGEIFTHSKYVALKSKDAIVDKFRRIEDDRPNVNPLTPDIVINIHIRHKTMTISLDSTGESLYKRGYRIHPVEAPINEVLAAGLIKLSGWNGESDFWDPMCGSGTIAIEAARIALDIPPQVKSRKFCFMNWPNFDEELYKETLNEVYNKPKKQFKYRIKASDKSIQSVKYTQYNMKEAGVEDIMDTERVDFFKADDVTNTTIITNPPYDERLKLDNINKFYKQIGDQLKQHCIDCQAWIISGNEEAIKSVGLKPNKKIKLYNGPIEAKYYNFDIYKGSASDEEE